MSHTKLKLWVALCFAAATPFAGAAHADAAATNADPPPTVDTPVTEAPVASAAAASANGALASGAQAPGNQAAGAQAGNAPTGDPARIKVQPNGTYGKAHSRRLEAAVRSLMLQTGFPDIPLQDAIIDHMEDEDRARAPMREKGEQLFLALQSPKVTDDELAAILKDFQRVIEEDRARRVQSEADLDTKIGYSKNPRLQSALLLFGIIGDGALFVPLREPPHPQKSAPVPAPPAPGGDAPLPPTNDAAADTAAASKNATGH